jgi:deoxyribonuclease V
LPVQIYPQHTWDLTPAEAVALQVKLAQHVDAWTPLERCELIAGADVAYDKYTSSVYAGVVVVRVADGSVVEQQAVVAENRFPYVPGLLSFREAPALLQAFARVQSEPDLVMLDGQGRAHPRRFGLACHLGLWLDRPCVGCAKTRYVGHHKTPDRAAGSVARLIDGGEEVGRVVRTADDARPVYVSVGHKIDLDSGVRWVLAAARGCRVPEPTRQADIFVNSLRRDAPPPDAEG